jgi:hypothetical protein
MYNPWIMPVTLHFISIQEHITLLIWIIICIGHLIQAQNKLPFQINLDIILLESMAIKAANFKSHILKEIIKYSKLLQVK